MIVGHVFNSNTIPVHLLTREPLDLYFRKLAKNGVRNAATRDANTDSTPTYPPPGPLLALASKRGTGLNAIAPRLPPGGVVSMTSPLTRDRRSLPSGKGQKSCACSARAPLLLGVHRG